MCEVRRTRRAGAEFLSELRRSERSRRGGVHTQCGVALAQPVPVGVQKSKMAAGLLGIFLGSLGIHNFYLGYTGKAVAQLLISVLSCGILALASQIWGLVEGIQILTGSIATDANGIPLKD